MHPLSPSLRYQRHRRASSSNLPLLALSLPLLPTLLLARLLPLPSLLALALFTDAPRSPAVLLVDHLPPYVAFPRPSPGPSASLADRRTLTSVSPRLAEAGFDEITALGATLGFGALNFVMVRLLCRSGTVSRSHGLEKVELLTLFRPALLSLFFPCRLLPPSGPSTRSAGTSSS